MVVGFGGYVLQVTHNQSVEITKEVRQCFDSSKTQPLPAGDKIEIRNDTIYKPLRSKDAWKRKYRRHKVQTSCGFFSPLAQPYETFGYLELDLRKLVVKTLGQNTFRQPQANEPVKRALWTKVRGGNVESIKSNDNDSGDKSTKGKEQSVPLKNMSLVIGEKLSSMKDRVVAVRAGQSYDNCLRKELRRKRLEILEEQKNEMQLTLNHAPSFIRKKSVLASRKSVGSSHEEVPVEELDGSRKLDVTELQVYHYRKCKNFTAVLRALYSLMCSVYHLKTRDLRTKVPLSRDYLKVINQDIAIDSKGKPVRHQRMTTTAHHNMSDSTDSFHIRGSDSDRVASNGANDSLPNVSRPPAMESGFNLEKQGTCFATKRFKNLMPRAGADDPPDTGSTQDNTTNRSGVSRGSFQTTFNTLMSSVKVRRGHFLGMLTNNVSTAELPVWQQIALNEKHDRRSRPGSIASSSRKTDKPSKHDVVEQMKDEFGETQKRCSKRLSEDMSRVEKLEKYSFRKKIRGLRMTHLLEQDLFTMRRSMNKINQDYRDEHVRPGWYDVLWDQAKDLDVEDDYDVDKLMQKIAPFSKDDVASLTLVKSKLCLIVQSIPLFELCQLNVQEAIKFFLEIVLCSSSNILTDWMAHRKIKPIE